MPRKPKKNSKPKSQTKPKSKAKSTRKKNRLFSNPTPKERTVKQLLEVDDLTTLTWREQKKLARYNNRMAKKLARENQLESWDNFLVDENNPDPLKSYSKIMAQKEFLNWKNIEESMKEHGGHAAKILEMDDKWTILRRLAAIDPSLNIDRAYASETLKDIEDKIESGQYRDLDEITDEYVLKYMEHKKMVDEWNSSLTDFATNPAEDAKLSANEGFHGVKKAEQRYQRELRRDLSGYAPMWQTPFWFDEV